MAKTIIIPVFRISSFAASKEGRSNIPCSPHSLNILIRQMILCFFLLQKSLI